jgi:hypothetical protein
MALSLDSIFHPFNDFFLTKFGSGSGAPVKFRFSRLPHTFVDGDFLISEHPEWGPSAQLAQEILSNVIDQLPTLDPDGRTVSSGFGTGLISDLYSDEMLAPAIPFVPAEVSGEANKQAIVDAFNQVKADARNRWETTKLSSLLQGQQSKEYRPSNPTPAMWWNRNEPSVWTPQTFEVKGATSPPQPGSPSDGILKMKIDDARMNSLLQAHPQTIPPQLRPALVRPIPAAGAAPVIAARPMLMAAARPAGGPPAAMLATEHVAVSPAANVAVHSGLVREMSTIPFYQRRQIQVVIAQNQPTQAIASSEVSIAFDYCVVNCERAWLHKGFLDNGSWFIPGQRKGGLSANDGHGVPALPVGFVAVKNLRIQAPWTPEDITNLELSVQFGPFSFTSTVVNGAISHQGLQIVGWMLQDVTDLPPNAGA